MKAMLNETFLAGACIMGFPLVGFRGTSQLSGILVEIIYYQGRIMKIFVGNRQ